MLASQIELLIEKRDILQKTKSEIEAKTNEFIRRQELWQQELDEISKKCE